MLITAAAAIFLGERIGPRRVAGVLVAFLGALIIIRPGSAVFTPAALLPLGGAACYAGYAIITRRVGAGENLWTSLFTSTLLGTIATTLVLPFVWHPIALGDLPTYALIGSFGALAQLFLIRAFTLAEASVIAPFGQSDILFATLFGYLLFGDLPDALTCLGALVIAAAGLYVWHREARTNRAPAPNGPGELR